MAKRVRADLRDEVLARERAKHQDKIDRLQRASEAEAVTCRGRRLAPQLIL